MLFCSRILISSDCVFCCRLAGQLLFYTIGVFLSSSSALASSEPRDYRGVFLWQKARKSAHFPIFGLWKLQTEGRKSLRKVPARYFIEKRTLWRLWYPLLRDRLQHVHTAVRRAVGFMVFHTCRPPHARDFNVLNFQSQQIIPRLPLQYSFVRRLLRIAWRIFCPIPIE